MYGYNTYCSTETGIEVDYNTYISGIFYKFFQNQNQNQNHNICVCVVDKSPDPVQEIP